MRLYEFILVESTEEDRAIVSLSMAISELLSHYDSDIIQDEEIGTIGELFTLPDIISNLKFVKLILIPSSDMGRSNGEYKTSELDGRVFVQIRINALKIHTNLITRSISHELRHALDDIKSGFRAMDTSFYRTPKKKEHRSGDEYTKYIADPAEINARFTGVLDILTTSLGKFNLDGKGNLKSRGLQEFYKLLNSNNIAELFPEGTKSKDYRRLLNRALDYIEKEVKYLETETKRED